MGEIIEVYRAGDLEKNKFVFGKQLNNMMAIPKWCPDFHGVKYRGVKIKQ